MTYLLGRRTTTRKGERLYEPLRDLTILTSALAYAMAGLVDPPRKYIQGDYLTVYPEKIDVELRLPLHGPLEMAMTGLTPDDVKVWFHAVVDKHPPSGWREFDTFGRVLLNAIAPVFAGFYEQQSEWLLGNVSTDVRNWSPICNFARVIRNCVSHTGHLTFAKPTSDPVSWHGLAYDPSQNGRLVVGGDLGFGDLLVLMFELSEEMTRLGAP